MKIPISKPYLTEEEAKFASEVILSGWVTQGPRVQEFEEKFAKYVGANYAVAVSSCTTALHLSLLVAGIKTDDEVICPSMSFIATANAIVHAGATPVFAEVNSSYNLDINDVEKRITSKTKAILLVHQIGMPADINSFQELCKKYNLKLIEDAACAIGSEYKEKKIGSHSELVCFSFHPRKVITTGDGGMITTNNLEYFERLKRLRQHSMSVNDRDRHQSNKMIFEEYDEVGFNFRMTDIQAAIGIKQLEKLNWIVQERRKISEKYNYLLKTYEFIQIPTELEGYFTNYQSYSIQLKNYTSLQRDELMQKLLDRGITTRRGVMCSHREKAYTNKFGNVYLPISEKISDCSIILPLFVGMTDQEIEFVVSNLLDILS